MNTFILLASNADHPNKHPFSGTLTYFDVPSDKPVGGSNGRLVLIPSDVGIPALTSLQGMAVNIKYDLAGHDSQNKIGVIEKAWAGDRMDNGAVPVFVSGYLYAVDFPDEVADLHANADQLGFSYETANTLVEDIPGALRPSCRVVALTFTGASILYKNKAAYTSTTLAAQEDTMVDITPESVTDPNEAAEDAAEELDETADAAVVSAAMARLADALTAFEDFKSQFQDGGKWATLSINMNAAEEKVSTLTERVDALTEALKASEEKVASLEAGKMNAAASDVVPKADFDALKENVDALNAAEDAREQYARRSYSATRTMSLLAQHGVEEGDSYEGTIKAIEKMDIPLEQKMALKFAARSARPADNA